MSLLDLLVCWLGSACLSVFTLLLMASRSEELLLWEWESFFDEINSFVQSADIDSMVQPMKDSHSM